MSAPRALLLLLALPLSILASETGIKHVWPEYKEAEQFERLGEYFGGKESHPGRCILRSQEGSRDGYYFLVRLDKEVTVPTGASWTLEVIRPGNATPATYQFAVPEGKQVPVYEIGLTGSDWSDRKVNPVAWRIVLKSSTGEALAVSKSLLWE